MSSRVGNKNSRSKILLLNPLGSSSAVWRNLVRVMSKEYECILIDYPGFSSEKAPVVESVENLTDMLVKTLIDHSLENCPLHVVGYSFGSWVAQQLITNGTIKTIKSLTLIGSSDRVYQQGIILINNWESIIDGLGLRAFLEQLSTWSFSTETFEQNPDIARVYVDATLANCSNASIYKGQLSMAKRYRRGADLSLINVPTLVLRGEFDIMYPHFCSEKLKMSIPDSSLRVIPNCGHAALWENPKKVIEEISLFLGGVK